MGASKKEAILSTALRLFEEHGIDATSVRAIARGADTAEGNIYRHFDSKTELARELFLNCAGRFRSALLEALKQHEDGGPEMQLRALVRTIFTFSITNRLAFSYIMVVNHRKEIITPDILSRPLPKDLFIDILQEGMDRGVFRQTDPNLTVAWIVGMVQRSFTFIQRGITPLSKEQAVEQTVNSALRMITT